MILHAADAVRRNVDTYVLVVRAIALTGMLKEQVRHAEVWVALHCCARDFKLLGIDVQVSAFTGCDNVSCFAERAKKTAFTIRRSYPAVTFAFLQLATTPTLPIMQ